MRHKLCQLPFQIENPPHIHLFTSPNLLHFGRKGWARIPASPDSSHPTHFNPLYCKGQWREIFNIFKTKFQMSRTLRSHKNVHEHRLVHVQAHTCRKVHICSHRMLCECTHPHMFKDSEKKRETQKEEEKDSEKLLLTKGAEDSSVLLDLETKHQEETIISF